MTRDERSALRGLAAALRMAPAADAPRVAYDVAAELERLAARDACCHVATGEAPNRAAPETLPETLPAELPEIRDRKGRPVPLERASDLIRRCAGCGRSMTRAQVEESLAYCGEVRCAECRRNREVRLFCRRPG